jgi:hypothetical protein
VEKPALNLLEKAFSFLSSKDAANPVLAGYFKKLVMALFKHKPKDIYQYIY